MDESDFLFLILFPIFAFFMILLIVFAAADNAQPPRLQVVCDNLDGKVVENVCIKNGAVVYKD